MANILDLPRDQFLASLNELAAQGVNTDDLRRQYRQRNSIFAPIFDWASGSEQAIADQGRTTAGMGLLSKEVGTTGMDALRSVRLEPSNFVAGLLSGGAQAVDAPAAAAQGLIPAQDMPMEALGTAGMAQVGGAAAPRPRGSLGANSLRVYHGGPNPITRENIKLMPDPEGQPTGFSVTPIRDVADFYKNMRGGGAVSEFDLNMDQAKIIGEYDLYDLIDQAEIRLGLDEGDLTPTEIDDLLREAGIDAIEYADPEFGIRVVNPNILSANRDATAGAIGAAASDFGRNWSDRYHWTRSNDFIDEFNPDISTSAMSQLGPHIGTKAAAEARMLAFPNDAGQMLNLRADLNKPFLDPRTNQPWSEVGLESYISQMAGYYGVDRRSVAPMIRRDLAAEGYTDIPYINDVEDAGSVSNIMLVDRPQSSDAVLRYQDALFDPLNRTSPNLNAANASPLAGILAMPNEEERNRQLGLLFGGY